MRKVNIEVQFLQLTTDAMFRLRSLKLASTSAASFLQLGHNTFPYRKG